MAEHEIGSSLNKPLMKLGPVRAPGPAQARAKHPLPTPRLVIFDCDGVLVDSERLSHEVLRQMLRELGVELTLAGAIERFMGTSTHAFLERATELIGGPVPAGFLERFAARSFDAFKSDLRAVDGIHELLAALPIPYCVASNGPVRKMRFTLGHTGLLPHFEDRLFSADQVATGKPAPDLFLHAARTLSTPPAECVVIEDTPTGIVAARAAGMQVLGYAGMMPARRLVEAGASATFRQMDEVPSLLRLPADHT
jgi:HAD superfamily hydrolase (TIGR01509 family)